MVPLSGRSVRIRIDHQTINVLSESIEWLNYRETQLKQTMDGFTISHYFKNGEKRILDESYGQIFLDGFSLFDSKSYAFEYNYGVKIIGKIYYN